MKFNSTLTPIIPDPNYSWHYHRNRYERSLGEGEYQMNPIKLFKSIFSKEGTTFDRWLDKKLNAYGWRGFVASLLFLGSGYILFRYSPAIIMFFGGDKPLPEQELTHQVRLIVVHKIGTVILILMIAKLIKQYASKEEREAHQEKMRKDALMEAEILERKEEKENIGQKAD